MSITVRLDVLQPENCEACGLCCEGNGSPVTIYASRSEWRDCHPFRPRGLPQELVHEIDEHLGGLFRGQESQQRCLWFDADARRCRHYEWRPQVCRDYELGGIACLTLRSACMQGMDPHELLPLFVFGTLRRGEPNHHFLEGTFERWLPGTLRGYARIVASHGFPAIAPAIGAQVAGELFFIRPEIFVETLADCDLLEEIPPGELTGRFYRRAQVVVETATGIFTAWAYV